MITLGNHTYRHREVWPYLDEQAHILRPANFLRTQPGHGTTVVERDGSSLGVVNLSGNLYMQAGSPALVTIDEALREVADATTCSSTCTPRPRARRSRSAGTSTGA